MSRSERETVRDRPRVPVSPGRLVYVGIGSNLGDRRANLEAAIGKLQSEPGVRVMRRSALYETEPVGVADQPWFVNGVLELDTDLTARDLLVTLKRIERELGRLPARRWAERAIDLDLLLYEDQAIAEPELVIPHPRLWRRLFVLLPLAELAPHLRTPDGRGIQQVIADLRGSQAIRPLIAQNGP
jgi:2-amino-4-hydroxy-6-hydroxymethyldihydropteridine diphosphokinase